MYIFVFIPFKKIYPIKKERIFGLDLLRAIAIIAVLLAHTTSFLKPLVRIPVLGSGVGSFMQFCRPLGQFGVELFFVLSGFLIGTIFIDTFIKAEPFEFKEVRVFWLRRWFRTLPNYWLILSANILLYLNLLKGYFDFSWLWYYIFAQNLWYPHPRFFGEAWSLAIEEWFYLLFPITIYLAHRKLKPANKRLFFLRTLVMFLAFFVLLRMVHVCMSASIDQDADIRKVVVFRLDALGYGTLMAYLVYFKKRWIRRTRTTLFATGIVGVLIMYYLMASDGLDIGNATQPVIKFLSDAFLYLLLPVVFALLLPFANGAVTTPYNRFGKGVQFVSKISYSIYLIHFSLIYLPFFDGLKIENPALILLFYLIYWIVTIGLSYCIYRYFEMPMMQKRNKYS